MFLSRVLQEFQKGGIQYALVGGFAVALHGAVRGTVDIDLLVALDEDTLQKVERIMHSVDLVSRVPVTAREIATFREEYIKTRNLFAWSFINTNNPTEVVDIVLTHDVRHMKVERKQTALGALHIVSVSDLISMKQAAGRPQDLADIEALQKIQER